MKPGMARKWLRICALALPFAVVVVAFLPSVRGKFIDGTDQYGHSAKSRAAIKIVPLSMLPGGGESFERKRFAFTQTGYPAAGGRALYWVKPWVKPADRGEAGDYLLVSLPDCRILCRVTGFDNVFWLPGGKAMGVTVTRRSLPSWSALDRLRKWIGGFAMRYYEIDWKGGGSKEINIARLPKASQPTFNELPPGCQPPYVLDPPFLSDAYERAGRMAIPWLDQKTNLPVMHVYTRRTQTPRNIPLVGTDGTASLLITFIADDEVLYVKNLAAGQQALFRMTLATGEEKQVWPKASIDSSAAN